MLIPHTGSYRTLFLLSAAESSVAYDLADPNRYGATSWNRLSDTMQCKYTKDPTPSSGNTNHTLRPISFSTPALNLRMSSSLILTFSHAFMNPSGSNRASWGRSLRYASTSVYVRGRARIRSREAMRRKRGPSHQHLYGSRPTFSDDGVDDA
jgi:hypothetical protein